MVETLYATSHITGDFPDPDNAIGDTPSTWAGTLDSNSSYTSRWAIDDPLDPLRPDATHTVRVLARKGENSGDPSLALNLYENGSLVQSIVADTTVTSTTGQTVSGTFPSSAISNPNDIEVEVVQSHTGGSPTARNSAQISHIELEADTEEASGEMHFGELFLTSDAEVDATPRVVMGGSIEMEAAASMSSDQQVKMYDDISYSHESDVEISGRVYYISDIGFESESAWFIDGEGAGFETIDLDSSTDIDMDSRLVAGGTIDIGSTTDTTLDGSVTIYESVELDAQTTMDADGYGIAHDGFDLGSNTTISIDSSIVVADQVLFSSGSDIDIQGGRIATTGVDMSSDSTLSISGSIVGDIGIEMLSHTDMDIVGRVIAGGSLQLESQSDTSNSPSLRALDDIDLNSDTEVELVAVVYRSDELHLDSDTSMELYAGGGILGEIQLTSLTEFEVLSVVVVRSDIDLVSESIVYMEGESYDHGTYILDLEAASEISIDGYVTHRESIGFESETDINQEPHIYASSLLNLESEGSVTIMWSGKPKKPNRVFDSWTIRSIMGSTSASKTSGDFSSTITTTKEF